MKTHLSLFLVILFAYAARSVAEEPAAEPKPFPPRLGAGFWLLQDGSADQGPSYDLLSFEFSPPSGSLLAPAPAGGCCVRRTGAYDGPMDRSDSSQGGSP